MRRLSKLAMQTMSKRVRAKARALRGGSGERRLATFVATGLLALAAMLPSLVARAGAPTPNLVVILVDDLSTDALDALLDVGLMPNLQRRLMDVGVTFENAFVTDAICCPSRATYLRGQYAHNHGVLSNLSSNVPELGIASPGWFPANGQPGREDSTIATWLAVAGYTTGFIGKYLNGYGIYAPEGELDPATYIPPGWDDWQGLLDPTTYQVYDYRLNDNGTVLQFGDSPADYQTDVLAARAVEFIEARALGAEKFFLTVTPLAPHVEVLDSALGDFEHGPLQLTIRPAPRHMPLLNGNPADGEVPFPLFKPSFNEADMSDKPSCPRAPPTDGELVTEPQCVGDRSALQLDPDIVAAVNHWKSMLASMLAVDDLLGLVLDAIDTNGLAGETVVLFTSDNGYMYGEHRLHNKQVPYEESIRVPLVVRGPGFATGVSSPAILVNNDNAPTLAFLGGATPTYDPDGANFVPLLLNPANSNWSRRSLLVEHWFIPSVILKFENPSYAAVRSIRPSANFLYVAWRANTASPTHTSHREFYNLAADPFQLQSVALSPSLEGALDGFVSAFRGCAGQGCRDLESF